MKNQLTRNALYDSIKMDDELYHHGVLGMSWGDRNGPPYPLSGSAKKIARAEAKKKIEQERRLEKMRKAAATKRKEEAKAAKKQAKIDKKKAKILSKNKMRALYRNRKLFTNEEIEGAIYRNKALIEARYAKNPKKAPDPHALDRLVNMAQKLGMAASAIKPLVDLSRGIVDLDKSRYELKIKDIDRQSQAFKDRYNMLMAGNPRAAMEYLNKKYGTKYEYDSTKERIDVLKSLKDQYDIASKELSNTTDPTRQGQLQGDMDYLRNQMKKITPKMK